MKKKACAIVSLLTAFSSFAVTTSKTLPNGDLVLENDNVRLVYDGGKNYKFKEFTTGGKNILPQGGSVTHPWQMTYLGPNGENPNLMPRNGEYVDTKFETINGVPSIVSTWKMVLTDKPEWEVRAIVSLSDDSELPEWNIEAYMPEGWLITNIEYPRISAVRPKDAKGILPVGFGTEYNLGSQGQIQAKYPSCTGTMQLVMMHSPEGTWFFAPRDTEGSGKIMRIKSEGNDVIFMQELVTSYGWTKDGKFTIPYATVMGFNPDNWCATAMKWYRPWTFETEWGKKTIQERNIAEWIKNADMWMRPGDVSDETVQALHKGLDYYGKGVGLHWYYWHNHPFDTHYPDYFPEKPGFRQMIKDAQKKGAYVTPYINGRLWDPATQSYKNENAHLASCRKPDGSLYTEVYSSKVLNTVTCPASDIWQNKLKELNKLILDSLSTNGVYMDQIGCATSEPCYAENHHHAKGAGSWWPQAYRKVLTEMRNEFYKPNQAMTTEENAEPYIDLFDMMLVVNSPHNSYTKMIPLFPLIYSDRCIYSGYTYVPWKINDGSLNFMSMRSLLWGSQLGWVNPQHLMADNATTEAAFLKTLVNFRKKNHDIFVGGRYLGEFVPDGDNEIVEIPGYQKNPVVLGAEWLSTKGKHVYVVVNMSDKDRKVNLPSGKQIIVKAYSAMKINKE